MTILRRESVDPEVKPITILFQWIVIAVVMLLFDYFVWVVSLSPVHQTPAEKG